MKIFAKEAFDIDVVLSDLDQCRKQLDDGRWQFTGFPKLSEAKSYLRTAIFFEEATDAFAQVVIDAALRTPNPLNKNSFIRSCKKFAEELTHKRKIYKVLFPVWRSPRHLKGRRYWGNATLTFGIKSDSAFAKRALSDRSKQANNHRAPKSVDLKQFEPLPLALCSVQAINEFDAFEQAEIAMAKELGLYSLFLARGEHIFSSYTDQPISQILMAPHMTVHDSTGAIIKSDLYWHNRWPTSFKRRSLSQDEDRLLATKIEHARKRLKGLPWRELAEDALARHYFAFSKLDHEASFLEAWRLLEAIAGKKNEKSVQLVVRASWFFEANKEYYEKGLHLKHRRDLISHGRPVKDQGDESLAFQMKQFLQPFLLHFLINPYNFKSIEELWEFCDLPVDPDERERKIRLISHSQRFREEK